MNRTPWCLAPLLWFGVCAAGCDEGPSAEGAAPDVIADATPAADMSSDDIPDAMPVPIPDAAPDAMPPAPDMGPAFLARPRNPPAADLNAPRGFSLARGLIHMHNVYSHDACDGMPLDEDGTPNQPCHQRFRDAMCHNRHDFVLMTDHPDSVGERSMLEALYHRDGDRLELLDGAPVANVMVCPDGHEVLLAAGSEGDMMPVMFRQMPDPALLRDQTPEGIARLRSEAGALVFQAHMERYSGPDSAEWGLDGQEIYNIHANLDPRGTVLGTVMPDLARLIGAGLDGPHPDLWFTGIFRPGDAALANWDWTIARTRMPGFAGSDTHENVPLPIETGDGERIESYRRITGWFSNRLLLDGPPSEASVRAALVAGRIYVVFDALGAVDGFDFRAEDPAGAVLEMGSEAPFAPGWRIRVDAPRAPAEDTVELRLLQVTEDGTEVIAETTDATLDVEAPGPGAYRVEVRLTAEHLRPEMGTLGDVFIRPQVWAYGNPVYLR